MEENKRKILNIQEVTWCFKRRQLLLNEGDMNTIFFIDMKNTRGTSIRFGVLETPMEKWHILLLISIKKLFLSLNMSIGREGVLR